MKNLSYTVVNVTLCLFLFLGLFTPVTHAKSLYTVTPLALNYDLEKRDIISDSINIKNNSARKIRLYATVNTVATDGQGVVENFQQKVSADKTNTPTTWIEISRKRIEINPGEQIEIPFTIRMNPNTKAGDYNVFIGLAEGSKRNIAAEKVRNGEAPGTLIHISVDKKQNKFLRLDKFIVKKFITNSTENAVSFTLSNPGTSKVIPKGEIIFYTNKGIEVAALPVNAENQPITEQEDMTFTMDIPTELSMGKYKAFLSVEYGDHMLASVHDTNFFYVLPLKQLVIIFLIVLFLALVISLYIHRRYNLTSVHDGSENVTMYVKDGVSKDIHHDIDLSQQNEK